MDFLHVCILSSSVCVYVHKQIENEHFRLAMPHPFEAMPSESSRNLLRAPWRSMLTFVNMTVKRCCFLLPTLVRGFISNGQMGGNQQNQCCLECLSFHPKVDISGN